MTIKAARNSNCLRMNFGYCLFMSTMVMVSTAFEFPNLATIFKPPSLVAPLVKKNFELDQQKAELLREVSNTNNGKTATPEKQAKILAIVGNIEKQSPNLSLADKNTLDKLDGVWFLQYTSPSTVGNEDQFPNEWKPQFATEIESKIETKQFNAQGSVSAAGVTVDTSNRVVRQIFNIVESTVSNNIELDFGTVRVGGPFRQSSRVPNRAIVSFQQAEISFKNGFTIDFGFVFSLIALASGTKENGWLETTFLSDDIRIGRGNKGTMFVLTRDPSAVQP